MFTSRSRSFHMVAFLTFRLLLAVLTLQRSCQGQSESGSGATPRVIGGVDAPRKRFPYVCSLRRHGARQHICAGTLIKPRWVLTAAHCLEPASAGSNPLVYCGIYHIDDRDSNKWSNDVEDGFDIALIKLKEPCGPHYPLLQAKGNRPRSGDVFVAVGWGLVSEGRQSDLLQIADRLPFYTRDICNRANYWNGQIMDSMICAGSQYQDTAKGDSGGPLLVVDHSYGDYTTGNPSVDLLVGITSFGDNRRTTFKPGVYTSVSYFRGWIDCITEEKENCSNDGQGTTGSSSYAQDSVSTSSTTIPIRQDAQPSATSEASYVSPERSGRYSARRTGAFQRLTESDIV